MTLMIIFGGAAALYLAMLLLRLAIHALPISAGLIAASLLHDHGTSWAGATAWGFIASSTVYLARRSLMTDSVSLLLRFPVLLLFSSAAACAGYQAGLALAKISGFDADWQRSFAVMAALVTVAASWRGLMSPARVARDVGDRARGEIKTRLPKSYP